MDTRTTQHGSSLIIVGFAHLGGHETFASTVSHGSSAYPHELFERLPELRVEYRVDHGVHETIHVAQPRGQNEHPDAGRTVLIQFVAYRVQDVAREERHPAEQENTWNAKRNGAGQTRTWHHDKIA